MNWTILSLMIIVIGLVSGIWWISIAGAFLIILDMARPRSVQKTSSLVLRHKLIQAPSDAWDTSEDDMLTFLGAEHGMPNQLGVDILEPITGKIGENLGPLETGLLRQILPFKAYGESSALQRSLAGLVLPLDNWLYPKTFEAKMKGKLKDAAKKTFVIGQEEDAKKALDD